MYVVYHNIIMSCYYNIFLLSVDDITILKVAQHWLEEQRKNAPVLKVAVLLKLIVPGPLFQVSTYHSGYNICSMTLLVIFVVELFFFSKDFEKRLFSVILSVFVYYPRTSSFINRFRNNLGILNLLMDAKKFVIIFSKQVGTQYLFLFLLLS